MDHKEQHHEHHRKEREHEKAERHHHEQAGEKGRRGFHPAWFVLIGLLLTTLAVMIWTFIL